MSTSTQTIPAGCKQTEIGTIPADWNVVTFRSIVSSFIDYRGVTPRKLGMEWGGGDIRALSANNVQMGYVDFEKECYVASEALYKRWMRNGNCEKGDILLTMEAPLGNVASIPDDKKYILSQRTILIKPTEIIAKDFLRFLMSGTSFQKNLSDNSSGTTAQGIQRKKLEKIEICFPENLSEQAAIAATLSDADTLIVKLEALLEKKKNIKQGAMQELLTGKRRLPGFSGEWEEYEFERAFRKINSKNYQIQTIEYSDAGLYPVIDQGQDRIVAYSDNADRLFKCPEGGVIIFGDHTRIVKYADFNFLVGADGTQVLASLEGSSAKFRYYQLSQKDIPNTGYNRHFKYLKEFVFATPRLAEQVAISAAISDMDQEIEGLESQLTKYQNLKQGMMQVLLTGKIRLI